MQETWVPSLGQEDLLEEDIGNPLQYSCLDNLVDREAWWATVHRAAKSWTELVYVYKQLLLIISPPVADCP